MIGSYFVKNTVYKNTDMPQDTIDKRADIVKTLPAALAEYARTNNIEQDAQGRYTAGQEMVLLAKQATDTLSQMIEEKQLLSKAQSIGDKIGINRISEMSPIVVDIKLVKDTSEALMEQVTNSPEGVHTKALLTVTQKVLNLGIEKGFKVKTDHCDNVSVELKNKKLHIAVIDENNKNNKTGYTYIPIEEFKENDMIALTQEQIDKFSLIRNMPKILSDIKEDLHKNPQLPKPQNRKEAYISVMNKIMAKIDSRKDETENMTYAQYFLKTVGLSE